MRILLTGAGTLIGQAVLDCLEGRRDGVHLIGLDLDPSRPTVQRYDEALPAPPDSEPAALLDRIREVAAAREVDLIVPCRDPHIPLLAAAQDAGTLPAPALTGPLALARMIDDKLENAAWARDRGLPFATSVASGAPDSAAEVADLIDEVGLPLIAKPIAGSGSLGVRVLVTAAQARAAADLPGLIIQPFLDPPPAERLDLDLTCGVPLFWEVPVTRQCGGQVSIGPDGRIGTMCLFDATLRLGRVEGEYAIDDAALERTVLDYAEAMSAEGWRGPLNVQARRDSRGRWTVFELGGRFSGGTSTRLHLGQDEVAWIFNAWAGREVVPPWRGRIVREVTRTLMDVPVLTSAVDG